MPRRFRRFLRLQITGFSLAALAVWAALPASPPHCLQQNTISITLAGQSMIRSDIRATAPAAGPAIRSLLHGDVIFTNVESAVAEKGETVHEGRGFLHAARSARCLERVPDLTCSSLSGNHAFDLELLQGYRTPFAKPNNRTLIHAGTGNNLAESRGAVLSAHAEGHGRAGLQSVRTDFAEFWECHSRPSGRERAPHRSRRQTERDGQRSFLALPTKPTEIDEVFAGEFSRASAMPARMQRYCGSSTSTITPFFRETSAFSTIFTEGMPERLAPNDWLKGSGHTRKWMPYGSGHRGDAWSALLHGVEIYHGRPIFYDLGNFIYNAPPTLTYIDEPMSWESAVAYVEFEGKNLRSITFRPIALNTIGEGQPDIHSEYTNNQFLDTRGLPSLATGAKATYILQRLSDASKPFGTIMEIEDGTATVKLKAHN